MSKENSVLWKELVSCIYTLRDACKRKRTFIWMTVTLIAWVARPDLLGVTSFVRSSFLSSNAYHLLLNFFHSEAIDLTSLLKLWVRFTIDRFNPLSVNGRLVFVADGLKVAKEGKKMPAVKCLHQESGNNSKPEYIMGHSFQVISLLATAPTGQHLAVPLLSRICEGILDKTQGPKTSLLDKLAAMFLEVVAFAKNITGSAILVADAYYASKKVIIPLVKNGHHLVSRMKRNAVGYHTVKLKTAKRGRPKKYGQKTKVLNLFKSGAFITAKSPVYGESNVDIRYLSCNLLWRPIGSLVQFVLVKHPIR